MLPVDVRAGGVIVRAGGALALCEFSGGALLPLALAALVLDAVVSKREPALRLAGTSLCAGALPEESLAVTAASAGFGDAPFTNRCSRASYVIPALRSSVTTRALLPFETIVRDTRVGADDGFTALALKDSRGGVFNAFQLSPATLTIVSRDTVPPATGKMPRARLIGAFPRTSNGCVGTSPNNPDFDLRNTPVTGRYGENPFIPNPNPGDQTQP